MHLPVVGSGQWAAVPRRATGYAHAAVRSSATAPRLAHMLSQAELKSMILDVVEDPGLWPCAFGVVEVPYCTTARSTR